jgi:hypothetical protein
MRIFVFTVFALTDARRLGVVVDVAAGPLLPRSDPA